MKQQVKFTAEVVPINPCKSNARCDIS